MPTKPRRGLAVLAVLMLVLGASAVGLMITAGVGLGVVGVLFCDAPGSTTMDCVLSGAIAGVTHSARYLLPVAAVALLLGGAFRYWSR